MRNQSLCSVRIFCIKYNSNIFSMTTIIQLFTKQSEVSALPAERPDEICVKLILPGLNEKRLFRQNDFLGRKVLQREMHSGLTLL